MPNRRDKQVEKGILEFVESMMKTITESITLDKETTRLKVRQVFDVLDDMTTANQMFILEICMVTHYAVFKQMFAEEEPRNHVDIEKLLALLVGLRMTLGIGEKLFDHIKVEFFPEITIDR